MIKYDWNKKSTYYRTTRPILFNLSKSYVLFKEMSTETLSLLNRFSTKFDDKGATESVEVKE